MKKILLAFCALFALATEVRAEIPLTHVRVVGPSPVDVLSWPVTSEVTAFRLGGGKIVIDHTKRGQWPPVVIASDGTTQEATIWVIFRIGNQWLATGGERLRPNQTTKDLTQPNDIGPGWLYDISRWREMANYIPSDGEPVGFFVAAGSTRSDANAPVRERSNVVEITWNKSGGSWPPFVWTENDGPHVPSPPSPPVPPPVGVPAGETVSKSEFADLQRLVAVEAALWRESIAALQAAVANHAVGINLLSARVEALESKPIPIACTARARFLGISVPLSCELTKQ